ncbi:MAG: aminotransferase class III-fold pyridoxal phosphate-dependent enzyme [Rhizomicrobium sp.]
MSQGPDDVSELAIRALDIMPGGVSHDGRQLEPYGLFVRSAQGARKTGADGRVYIDFACGNGSILLGHGHKASIEAGAEAMVRGFHFSAGSEAELRWAEAVRALMPAAQQVRFTSSGNEACLLALAVSRAVSGNATVLTLAGHYHGWAAPAVLPTILLDGFAARGDQVTLVEAPDVMQATAALTSGRFGAVILEPTGASFGKLPLGRIEVQALVAAARAAGTICIFDETITGFRVAPGGAQELFGVVPDLIVLGKILGGGLPCGALAGRRDLLSVLDKPDQRSATARLAHGTGNGNPVVAAVGATTLLALADGEAVARAAAAGARLRDGLNRAFARIGVPWAAYGQSSGFHLFLNPAGRRIDPMAFDATHIPAAELNARNGQLTNDLRIALLAAGVDINPWPGGLLSAAHDAAVIDEAVAGFSSAIEAMSRHTAMSGWAG